MPAVAADDSRFDAAYLTYEKRINAFARKSVRLLPSGTEVDDVKQEILITLSLACKSYDPDKGAKFSTHFWNCAQNKILDMHKSASRQKRVGDYEREWLDDETVRQVVSDTFLGHSAEDEVMALINVREILRMRYEAE